MKNSCTLIPIYPPDFNYGLEALITHNKFCDTPLYFVFSSKVDYESFSKIVSEGKNKNLKWNFIIADNLDSSFNIITAKKFFGVKYLSSQYKYIGVFDSEILFVKHFNTEKIYKEIHESKIFKSNKRHDSNHLKDLCKMLLLDNDERLIEQTENFTQYWWFNEICVYEQSLFLEFNDWLENHVNYKMIMKNFISFDYLIYSLWLICNKNYSLKKYLIDYSFAGAAIETNYRNNDISNNFKSYQDRNINHTEIDHIKVQIMIDRGEDHCKKEGEKKQIK